MHGKAQSSSAWGKDWGKDKFPGSKPKRADGFLSQVFPRTENDTNLGTIRLGKTRMSKMILPCQTLLNYQ